MSPTDRNDPAFDADATAPVTGTAPIPPMSAAERERIFGKFAWAPNPSPANKEAISVDPKWVAANILAVATPRLAHLGISHVRFHRLAIGQLTDLLEAWSNAGLLPKIVTWDGSYVPRLKRGKGSSSNPADLSNHSWGTAIDINARWNQLGQTPAPRGEPGSVRELVSLARHFGFFWGGDFHDRQDGMHFEVCRLIG